MFLSRGHACLGFTDPLNVELEKWRKKSACQSFHRVTCVDSGNFFGPYLSYVPKPALAVLVITIGLSLLNRHQIFVVTHSTGSDRAVFLITLIGGLVLPLDIAIVLGTVTSIFLFLKKAARPDLIEYAFNEEGQLAERKMKSAKF
jgi:SulP family sulfate permease